MKKARQIMKMPDYAAQYEQDKFWVRSQRDPDKRYVVSRTYGNGLVCECVDHQMRGADCKHIKVVLEIIKKNQCYKNNTFRIIDRSDCKICRHCSSGNVHTKEVRRNKKGDVQVYRCGDCKKCFSENTGFERTNYGEDVITGSLQMYFTGMSCRDIACHHEMFGINVSHMTVYNWVAKYSRLVAGYIDSIIPRTGNKVLVRADEVWVKVAGMLKYLFASMDDDTRFWLAAEMAHSKYQHDSDNLLHMTLHQIGRIPSVFITDRLPGYGKSCSRVFGRKTLHISDAGIKSKRKNRMGNNTNANYHPSNNKMERLNGDIQDRIKVLRGMKNFDSPIIPGMRIHYNYIKKHISLDGRTPAEQSKIIIDGRNKWKTLIQNASLAARQ